MLGTDVPQCEKVRIMTTRIPPDLTQSFEQFLWRAIRRRKWTGLLVCLLVCSLSAGLWIKSPRTYESDAYILISMDRINSNNLQNGLEEASFINTQAELLQANKVIEAAVARVGRENLARADNSPRQVVYQFLAEYKDRLPKGWVEKLKGEKSPEALIQELKKSLSVNIEAKSNLIRVSFVNPNPDTAAEFVNAVVSAYLDEYKQLYADTDTAAFLDRQIQDTSERLTQAEQRLTAFSTGNQIYSLSVQRDALLARLSQLNGAVAETKAALAQKTSEQTSVETQLAQLRPQIMTSEQLVSAHLDQAKFSPGKDVERSALVSDPPILLVKVYQETAQLIITRAMEKDGLTASLRQQMAGLDATQQKLDVLAQKEAQFNSFTTAVANLRQDLSMLLDKAREEKLRTAMSIRDLSNVRVASKATPSPIPVGPSIATLMAGFGVALMLSFLLMLIREVRSLVGVSR